MTESCLHVDFFGRTYVNPFLLASGPSTRTAEMIDRAFLAGWGGAVVKTIAASPPPDDVQPRFAAIRHNGQDIGLQNIEVVSQRPIKLWVHELRRLKEKWPDRILWASIMAGMVREDWQQLVVSVQKAGVDVIEVNVSCPNGMPDVGMGALIGQSASLVSEVIGWVKEVAEIPVIIKLSPNVTNIVSIAKAAQNAGVDGFTAINTINGISGIDLDRLTARPIIDGVSCNGGISGPALRPIALRAVANIVRETQLPVSGCGGISTGENALEFLSLGAGTVQLCTEPMLKGFNLVQSLKETVLNWMQKKGIESLTEIIGAALDKTVLHEELPRNHRFRPKSHSNCLACGKCVTACSDAGFQALTMVNNQVILNENRCGGCGLCEIVCRQKKE